MKSKKIYLEHIPDRLITEKEVAFAVGLSHGTIREKVKARTFPPPVQASERCVRWRLSDVLAWIEALPKVESLPSDGEVVTDPA